MEPRTCATLLGCALLTLATPASAAPDEYTCPSWEVFVGHEDLGIGASDDDGALYAAALGFYVLSDGDPVRNPWLVSLWVHRGHDGVPRDCDHGPEPRPLGTLIP